MKPNTEIPQEHKDRLFPHVSAAVEKVCEEYNRVLGGVLPDDVSYLDLTKRVYPAGYRWLAEKEEQLNSYDHTEDAYKKLCNLYVEGWTKMFGKIKTYYQSKLGGRK